MNQPSLLITQPLSVGGLFSLTFSLYKRFFFQALLLGLLAGGARLLFISLGENTDISNLELKVFYNASSLIAMSILWIYGSIAIFKTSSQTCLGLPVNWKSAFSTANQNVLRITWACFVTTSWCLIMSLLLVIPGIIAAINCILVFSIMISEDLPLGKSWTKSKALIKGFHWRAFLVLAALCVLPFLAIFLTSLLIIAFGGEEFLLSNKTWVSSIGYALTISLAPILCSLLYYDLRQRKEALDLNLQNKTEATPALAT